MLYAEPLTDTLTVVDNNITYKKQLFKIPTTLTGADDEGYTNYDSSTTYNEGDYAVVPDLHRLYRCTADNTTGVFPLSDASVWVDYGFINDYKMFAEDEQIGDLTTGSDMVLVYDFSRLDTIALIDVTFNSLEIKLTDNTTSTDTIYTIKGEDIGCLSYSEYFYSNPSKVTRVIKNNLEWLPDSTLTLTFTGTVKIGNVIVGNTENLGCTLYGTSLKFEDKSKIANDEFTGYRKVLRKGQIRILEAKIIFNTTEFNVTAQKISRIMGKNTLFIPTNRDRYTEMTNIAYIEEFELPVENQTIIETSATLIGVQKK